MAPRSFSPDDALTLARRFIARHRGAAIGLGAAILILLTLAGFMASGTKQDTLPVSDLSSYLVQQDNGVYFVHWHITGSVSGTENISGHLFILTKDAHSKVTSKSQGFTGTITGYGFWAKLDNGLELYGTLSPDSRTLQVTIDPSGVGLFITVAMHSSSEDEYNRLDYQFTH